ncbi:MAG: TonB-dependent receptor, partial [Rhodothermales bacterium]|nr:TonB-dependent receptor [Rhodothermales bacterium]
GGTDPEGQFVIAGLRPGRYAVRVSYVGFASYADTLALGAGERVTLAVALAPDAAELEGVEIEAAGPAGTSVPVGLVQVRPADLAALPQPDPGGDLASYLAVQPGVVTVGDRGGQLYVRGGEPTQNLVLVDGMRVFQPFHIVGFYSAFPSDLVRYADVYAGGFGARYGGRTSSVIDVTTRHGNKQRVEGAASVAPFLAAVQLEGPLVPGDVSFVASVRESVVERVAEPVLGESLPYRFGDVFGKVHAYISPTSHVTASALHTHDRGDLSGLGSRTEVGWTNTAAGGRFFYLPASFPAVLDVSAYYSAYASDFAAEGAPARAADVESFGGEFALDYLLGRQRVRFGFSAQTLRFRYTFDTAERLQEENTTEGSIFVAGDFQPAPRLRVEPGLRLQTFPAQQRNVSLEPRLRAAYAVGAGHTLSAAFGLYRQELIGITDARDIGDVFIAWAPIPQNAPTPAALHYILGWDARLRPWLLLGAEAYAKDLRNMQLLVGERGLVRTHGEAFGLDLRAEWRRAPFYLLATYGLSSVVYRSAEETYRPPHDRRHRVRFVGRWRSGPWAVALRFEVASGRPFMRLRGLYYALDDVELGGDFLTAPGTITALEGGAPFEALTPPYHRLDLAVERRFDVGTAALTAYASVVNAYDRANFFYFDVLRGDRVDQLPLIPSLGVRVEVD